MSKTIKVIDLLNKIANGEKPEKIRLDGEIYKFCESSTSIDLLYRLYGGNETGWLHRIDVSLDEEIEIIEEEPEIDIQDIKEIVAVKNEGNMFGGVYNNTCKINELIKAIKQLDKQIKEK